MKKEKSFTLIELLVVMAIIGLLASIVMVSLKGARERAQLAKTAQWARSVFGQLGADAVLVMNFNDCSATDLCFSTFCREGEDMVYWVVQHHSMNGFI